MQKPLKRQILAHWWKAWCLLFYFCWLLPHWTSPPHPLLQASSDRHERAWFLSWCIQKAKLASSAPPSWHCYYRASFFFKSLSSRPAYMRSNKRILNGSLRKDRAHYLFPTFHEEGSNESQYFRGQNSLVLVITQTPAHPKASLPTHDCTKRERLPYYEGQHYLFSCISLPQIKVYRTACMWLQRWIKTRLLKVKLSSRRPDF